MEDTSRTFVRVRSHSESPGAVRNTGGYLSVRVARLITKGSPDRPAQPSSEHPQGAATADGGSRAAIARCISLRKQMARTCRLLVKLLVSAGDVDGDGDWHRGLPSLAGLSRGLARTPAVAASLRLSCRAGRARIGQWAGLVASRDLSGRALAGGRPGYRGAAVSGSPGRTRSSWLREVMPSLVKTLVRW